MKYNWRFMSCLNVYMNTWTAVPCSETKTIHIQDIINNPVLILCRVSPGFPSATQSSFVSTQVAFLGKVIGSVHGFYGELVCTMVIFFPQEYTYWFCWPKKRACFALRTVLLLSRNDLCYQDERNPAVSVSKMSAALQCVSNPHQAAGKSKQSSGDDRVFRTQACLICTARDYAVHKTNSASVERTSRKHYSTQRKQHLCWFSSVWPSLLLLIIYSGNVLCSREQYVMHLSR